MKSLVFLAFVGDALALTDINSCQIPSKYATGAVGTCTGPTPGYLVDIFCSNPRTNVRTQVSLSTANGGSFVGPAVTGCRVNGEDVAYTTPLVCPAGATVVVGTPIPSVNSFKGVAVSCDTANSFYPVQGVQGSTLCYTGTAAYYTTVTSGTNAALGPLLAASPDQATSLTTEPTLTCAMACTLPTEVCTGAGVFNALVVPIPPSPTGLIAGTCNVRPGQSVVFSTIVDATTYTYNCAANANPAAAGVGSFVGYSGTDYPPLLTASDGAYSPFGPTYDVSPVATLGPNVLPAPYTGAAATKTSVTGPVLIAGAATSNAAGVSQRLAITGCAGAPACVQQMVSLWNCQLGYPVSPGSICLANRQRIACPTPDNGFGCPSSSSKKSLLGLLGLLGLIPLLLCCLLLCLLLFCCCRRKKSEGDVHFATYDPHSAPVVSTPIEVVQCASYSEPYCFPDPHCPPPHHAPFPDPHCPPPHHMPHHY